MTAICNGNETVAGWAAAAQVLGCSPTQVRRLVKAGQLQVQKDDRGVNQFSLAELEAQRDSGASTRTAKERKPAMADQAEPTASATATAPASAPAAPTTGAVAAAAFHHLDAGAGPVELVKELEVEPAVALKLYDDWKAAKVAGQHGARLLEAVKLAGYLRRIGWSAEEVVRAWGCVQEAQELLQEGTGFTGPEALDLLRTVRERGLGFREATEALAGLPELEEQAQLARQAEDDAAHAEQRSRDAHATLERLQAEIVELWPRLGWLRLAGALAALAEGDDVALGKLRAALALLPPRDALDQLLLHGAPEHEAEAAALQQAALWVGSVLPGVILRSEHEAALAEARREGASETARLALVAGML